MKKEDILNEIRRAAEANGGVPLGRLRFFNETGIKESDWKGKFWARWNDAVREAGVEPNQAQGAFEETSLIEKFIPILREFGRFPIVAEMRLRKRSDASFPNELTLKRRFGTRQQFAASILTYCQAREEYRDIAAICTAALDVPSSEAEDNGEVSELVGEVYLFKSGRHYKIGKTKDTVRRGSEIRIQLPEKLNLIHSIKTDDPSGIESYWHSRFESKRMEGEWFDLNSADVKAFKRWRRIY